MNEFRDASSSTQSTMANQPEALEESLQFYSMYKDDLGGPLGGTTTAQQATQPPTSSSLVRAGVRNTMLGNEQCRNRPSC